jgi:methyl-accepting chemotaxis protein
MNTAPSTANIALADRMNFMHLDAKACERIRQLKSVVDRELPVALDKFYESLRAAPEVRKFFENDQHMTRAKGAQIDHWSAISSGHLDDRYASKVRTIGLTHARIGLEPRWYIGGYALILEHLVTAIVSEIWPKGMMQRSSVKGGAEAGAALASLIKAVLLDMDLAISTYIEAAEARLKDATQEQVNERTMLADAVGLGLAKLADKDLTFRLTEGLPEAYGKLKSDFNGAIEQLEQAMQIVRSRTETMAAGTQEISSASNDLSRRTEQQACSLEEAASALDQITTTVKKTASSAVHAREVVSAAKVDAEQGGDVVRRAVGAMGEIEKSSEQISQIISVIDEIAFQTNLLALNAGVEAARAGDAGRGFAVVASEVRALAQRSADAAKEIKNLISTSTTQVSEGVDLVAETGKALERIVTRVAEVNNLVTEIATGAQEQASGLQEVNVAVAEMDKVTQQNAAMAEEATAASVSLAKEGDQMASLIQQFKLGGAAASVTPIVRPATTNGATAPSQTPRPALKTMSSRNGSAAVRKPNSAEEQETWQDF